MIYLRSSILFALLVLLSACSLLRTDETRASLKWHTGQKQPFKLIIQEEMNDGNNLHILAMLSSFQSWDMSRVAVLVTSLNLGSQVRQEVFILDQVLKDQLPKLKSKAGVYYAFNSQPVKFSIEHAGSTDYEIELLWGQDAARYLPKERTRSRPQVSQVSLRNLNIEKKELCDNGQQCQYKYSISAELFNPSSMSIQQAVLGVGYIFVPQGAKFDLSSQIPENEEQVELTRLNLVPGEARALSMDLDQIVPERTDGYYYPVVRLLETR